MNTLTFILSVLNLSILALASFLAYRFRKERLEIEKLTKYSKTAQISVEPSVSVGRESIEVINDGDVPIEKFDADIKARISNGDEETAQRTFSRETTLEPRKEAFINLHGWLKDFLKDNNYISIHAEEIPIRPDLTETVITGIHIVNPFSLLLDIKIEFSAIYGEPKTIRKKFNLFYQFNETFRDLEPELRSDPRLQYQDNFEIRSREIQGEWEL